MSRPLSIRAVDLGDEVTERLETWRQVLLHLGTDSFGGVTEVERMGQELRGAAAVATLAEIERLLREFMVEFSEELGRAGVPIGELTPSLRPLAAHRAFQSIHESRHGDRHWESRRYVTQLNDSSQIAQFPARTGSSGPQPPLDGKTIRAGHFERIWTLLGLSSDAVPTAAMRTSLNALSTLRNDIAHGNEPIAELFHPQTLGKSAVEIAEHIHQCALLVDHFCLSVSEYLQSKKYRTRQ